MTQAIAARREGDAFQARLFWMKAVRLLDPISPIVKVCFETGPKGFDDIWVEYDPVRGPKDQEGVPLLREHLQCKWHVSPGRYGHADLVDPEFINANSVSLLQRARTAQLRHSPDGTGIRFKLVTNWHVAQDDALRLMISQRSGTLRPDRLFGSLTDNSSSGSVRKLWREHLSIDDAELRIFTRTLALGTIPDTLDDLRDHLDPLLALTGLRRIPLNESAVLYDDLAFQWLGQGRLEFDKQTFRNACLREGLFVKEGSERIAVGVKSFEHAFDRLEDRCAKVLDLTSNFDERPIRRQEDWQINLFPSLKTFLLEAAKDCHQLRLVLDTHITLAFAAGSILNIKSGRAVELEQRTIDRRNWSPDDIEDDTTWPGWTFEVKSLCETGEDIAVAVGLTHNIELDVKAFAEKSLSNIGQLLVARISSGEGARSVSSGRHAFNLAEALALRIKDERKQGYAAIHLFVAGPNAFTFFLGQRQPSLGELILYEFDFEGQRSGTYEASLSFPVNVPV